MNGRDMGTNTPGWARLSTLLWAAAFVVAMIGMAFLTVLLPLPPLMRTVAMIAPMLLLIPMVRAAERSQAACGNMSPALRRYNRRGLLWAFSYVILLFGALSVYRNWHLQGALLWIVAILPSLPLFFFIGSMGRYLVEEQDEYLRQRAILASLWATGILLAVATCYGFFETFGLVRYVEAWAAVPVWAIGLAIGQLIVRKTT